MQTPKLLRLIKLAFLFLIVANAVPVQAKIAQVLCIKKINEILKHLPPNGETVAILDWDQTISSEEGSYTSARQIGEKREWVEKASIFEIDRHATKPA